MILQRIGYINYMKVDVNLDVSSLSAISSSAEELDRAGYDGLWTSESAHDPFLPIGVAALGSRRAELGTSIAVAFARNPMTVAYTAHDLQVYSGGRFLLGLGSQVRPHIERRFSMPWSQPVARMREFVSALHAIWDSWETGAPLSFRGEFYRHTLMTPFFTPPQHGFGRPKIIVAAVGEAMSRITGEVADGILLHGFTTERYIREVTIPAVEGGLAASGRGRARFQVAHLPLIATGRTEEEAKTAHQAVRAQVAFYGSTPSYRPVLALHGWGDLADELNLLSRSRREDKWDAMTGLVDDEVLGAFAVVAEPGRVAGELTARFGDVVDRMKFYAPYGSERSIWDGIRAELAASSSASSGE
jgi:probable F420-dependent oxidoreductase